VPIEILVAHLSSLSILVPLLIAVSTRRCIDREFSLLVVVLVISAVTDAILFILVTQGINNWPLGNLYILFQLAVFYFVFEKHYHNPWVRIAFFGFMVFSMANYFFIETPQKFNVNSTYVGGIFMILIASHYLYRVLKDLPVERIQDYPMLWIAFGVLIYFAGTLFLFLFNNYLMTHQPGNHKVIWILHNLLNLSKNIFFAIALWKNYRLKTSRE
jgi:hypothetical protein